MRPVLVLRPEPAASATVERAQAAGLNARAVPLFTIEPIAWTLPDVGSFDGLLLTSANSVRHAGELLRQLRGLPVYAVGDATADAARERGFDIKATGAAGIDRLLGSIEPDLNLLHLCGRDRKEPASAKQSITALPVYGARAVEDPDLGDLANCVALLHSPRAAERFAELVSDKSAVAIVAISPAAAQAAGPGWNCVAAAAEPNEEALLALAAKLCNKSAPK